MIKSKDRSGWFGASDTTYIMGNYNTDTFRRWWLQKVGVTANEFSNIYTVAGTYKEHQILDAVCKCRKDYQIKIPFFKLRVNLDGDTKDNIYEVKTYKSSFNKAKYEGQVNVQMLAKKLRIATIVTYKMENEDYENFFLPISRTRLHLHIIKRDREFLGRYLRRVLYLKQCLKRGATPSNEGADSYRATIVERLAILWRLR